MRQFLHEMFHAAIAAADPQKVLPDALPPPPKGRTIVVGAGKAAASMARALEDNWPGPLQGLVVTRYGHGMDCDRIEVVEAAHPVPDAAGLAAAARVLKLVQGLAADDLVICLISGGGSSLLTLPAEGLTLADKQAINAALLRSGAPIGAMNIVRKHLSAIKGGQLAAAAAPARVVTLVISDVPGDDPSVVASGPTVADATTFADAMKVVERYGITEPENALRVLRAGLNETPKPGDRRLANNEVKLVATARSALQAASAIARSHGFSVLDLGDAIEGEARRVGQEQARVALAIMNGAHAMKAPCVILSGGETTVSMKGHGKGGRNSEFLLALAIELKGAAGIHALAGDTDGIDGSEDNAGAIIGPDTLSRMVAMGIDPQASLDNNDAFTVFEKLGDLVLTGPTLTNVNDFRAIVVNSPE